MRNLILMTITRLIIVASGCKKDNTETTSDSGSWTLGEKTYKVAFSNKGTTSGGNPTTLLIFADGVPQGANPTVNTLNFSFKEAPTTSGSYDLMGTVGGTLTASQCVVSAGSASAVYAYLGSPVKVQITVTGGKVKIQLPEITVKSTVASNPDVKLSGTVQEM